MTKKRRSRINNSFDGINAPSENLVLANLDLTRDDWNLAPVSLTSAISDHQLVNNAELMLPNDHDPLAYEPTSFENNKSEKSLGDILTLDKNVDEKQPHIDILDIININEPVLAFEQLVATPFNRDNIIQQNESLLINETCVDNHLESLLEINSAPIEKHKPSSADDTTENISPECNPKLEQDDLLNTVPVDLKKEASVSELIGHHNSKLKRPSLICYVALGFSFMSLVAIAFLMILIINTKANVTKLTESVHILEENMNNLTTKYENLENNTKVFSRDSNINQINEQALAPVKLVEAHFKKKVIRPIVNALSIKKINTHLKHSANIVGIHKKYKPHSANMVDIHRKYKPHSANIVDIHKKYKPHQSNIL